MNQKIWNISLTITPTTPFDSALVKDGQWERALTKAEAQVFEEENTLTPTQLQELAKKRGDLKGKYLG
jgi:hypothetical protein